MRGHYQPVPGYKDTVAMASFIYENPDRICGCLSHRQATALTGLSTLVYSCLIIVHEVVLERGFDTRNYVVIAFCIVWIIVTFLLFLALAKKAQFLLLPWLILSSIFTPMFVVAIVAGCRVVAICISEHIRSSCVHEYHLFGSTDHTVAIGKLALLVLILFSNMISILVVLKTYNLLSGSLHFIQEKVDVQMDKKETYRYKRFDSNSEDCEMQQPLCEELLN